MGVKKHISKVLCVNYLQKLAWRWQVQEILWAMKRGKEKEVCAIWERKNGEAMRCHFREQRKLGGSLVQKGGKKMGGEISESRTLKNPK